MSHSTLRLYAFRKSYLTVMEMYNAWLAGESFCRTLLPHPTKPDLVSIRDEDDLLFYDKICLVDPLMRHQLNVANTEIANGPKQSPADTASRPEERVHPQGEHDTRRIGEDRPSARFDLRRQAVDEDGELKQASLTILAAMLASPAHAETPVAVLVDKSIDAAAGLLNKIYGCD